MVRIRRGISLFALGTAVLGTPFITPLIASKAARAIHDISPSVVLPLSATSIRTGTERAQNVVLPEAPPGLSGGPSSLSPSQFQSNSSQNISQMPSSDSIDKGLSIPETSNDGQATPLPQASESGNPQTTQPLLPVATQESPASPASTQMPSMTPSDTAQTGPSTLPSNIQDSPATQPATTQAGPSIPSDNVQTLPGDIGQAVQSGNTPVENGQSSQAIQSTPQTDNQDSLQTLPGSPISSPTDPQTQLNDGTDALFGITGPFSASISWGPDTATAQTTTETAKVQSIAANLRIADTNGSASTYQLMVDWGDDVTMKQVIGENLLNKSFQISGMHAYSAPGTYRITLTLLDNQGNQISTTRSVVVTA